LPRRTGPLIVEKIESVISHLIEQAKNLGFVSMGISRPGKPLFFDYFCEWIAASRQGDMHWLARHLDIRQNPLKLLPGCQSIISLAYPYSAVKPLTSDGFSTARYTEPDKPDYHDRLKRLARGLVSSLLEWYPGCKNRICVDSAPILERSFAYASGMGFIGKNNTLIIPGYGSYVFLAEILTTAQIPQTETIPKEDKCGSCILCLDACPTGALEAPYSLNASKCLSYLTIEYHGAINNSFIKKMGNCFFGCDLCQEVCPFNEYISPGKIYLPSADDILGMEENEFKARLGKTAFKRAGLKKIKSNIRAIKPDSVNRQPL